MPWKVTDSNMNALEIKSVPSGSNMNALER